LLFGVCTLGTETLIQGGGTMHHSAVPDSVVARMREVRRDLHRHPELAFQEERTAARIMAELDALGISYDYGGVGSGVIGRLGAQQGPTIALRADMDALPGEESTQLPFASEEEGRMHACGHDAHVAMVLGAAHLLAADPPALGVRLVFQPAEEKGGGARTVIAAGALEGVSAIFGAHVTHHYRVGQIMVADGVITAQSDRFRIDVRGRGGHGARPHEATDAVVITGFLITALQTLVSREIDPIHPSVVTIGRVEAGSAPNVIAETAVLEGSIRTTLPSVRDQLHAGVERMARALGDLHNAELEVMIQPGYPPVVNTVAEARLAERAARAVVGDAGLMALEHPSMGSEDFAYYLERIPGCYVRFGARPEGSPYVPLHSPAFDIDEGVLPVGAAFFDAVVREAERSAQWRAAQS
jgi:hippurate hydrolase